MKKDPYFVAIKKDSIVDTGTLNSVGRKVYLYQYEDKEIQCTECKDSFSHKYLECEEAEDLDGGTVINSKVCPNCGAWNCCSVRYESIRDLNFQL